MAYDMIRAKRIQIVRGILNAHWPDEDASEMERAIIDLAGAWDDDIENFAAEAAEKFTTIKNDLDQAIGFLWRQS